MNKFSKMAVAGVSLLTITSSAYAAAGDLLVGFTGASSDFIYDLGAYSTITPGETWTIGSNLGSSFGVIGYKNTGKHIYATYGDPSEAGFTFGSGNFTSITDTIDTIANGLTPGTSRTTTPTDTTGWTTQTDQPPGTSGNTYQNQAQNPNVPVGSPAYFFDNLGNSSSTPPPVGIFTYNSSTGKLTFSASAPAPVTLSIQRQGNVSTISFPSASGVTYSLCYTNSAGLSTAVTNWPTVSTNITGDGTIKSFLDTNSSSPRFYKVKEH